MLSTTKTTDYLNKFLLFITLVTALSACKKKDNRPSGESVNINGNSYQTVRIGDQLWTSVNYNGAGGINYQNAANDPTIGKYYTRQEAQSIALPDGWRLPSKSDFEKLAKNFPHDIWEQYIDLLPDGVQQLTVTTSWNDKNGNNNSGFNAMAAGYVYIDAGGNPNFRERGYITHFISSTNEIVSSGGTLRPKSWTFSLSVENSSSPQGGLSYNGGVGDMLNSDWYRYSVRFVKDAN